MDYYRCIDLLKATRTATNNEDYTQVINLLARFKKIEGLARDVVYEGPPTYMGFDSLHKRLETKLLKTRELIKVLDEQD